MNICKILKIFYIIYKLKWKSTLSFILTKIKKMDYAEKYQEIVYNLPEHA